MSVFVICRMWTNLLNSYLLLGNTTCLILECYLLMRLGLFKFWLSQEEKQWNWTLSYCRGTVQHAMLVNFCYALRGMGVRKLSNSKSDLRWHWQWCHSIGHIRFLIRLPLQLCLCFAPFLRYHLCPKIKEVMWPWTHLGLRAPGIVSFIITVSRQLPCFLVLTVSNSSFFTPALLKAHLFVFCCPRNPQNLSQPFRLNGVKTCFFITYECPVFTAVRCYRPHWRFH